MNTNILNRGPNSTQPDAALSFGDGDSAIGLIIDIPTSTDPASIGLPPENLIGCILLENSLKSALQREGILIGMAVFGELNAARGLFHVNDRNRALRTIKEVLETSLILPSARFGWFCRAEKIWRQAWPTMDKPDNTFALELSEERIESARLQNQAWVQRLLAFDNAIRALASYDRPSADGGEQSPDTNPS